MALISQTDPIDWIVDIASRDAGRIWLEDDRGIERYGELLEQIGVMAARLRSLGVCAGDRVAAQVEKSREALHLYLGCLWMGAIYLPLNNGYAPAEIDYFLKDASPALFVCAPDQIHAADCAVATLDIDGSGSLTDARADMACARFAADPDDVAAMLYTSGTTGKPKGAMLTRRNLASSAATLVEAWQFSEQDRLIHALPIFHVHGLFVATNTILASGASMLLMPKFDVDAVIVQFERATVLMGVPTFYTRLLGSDRLTPSACKTMRLFVSGSAPLLAETHRAFEARTGHAILERYGMTETMMNTSNPYDGARIPGTVGRPLQGIRLRVVDADTHVQLPPGHIGMIEVKGPNVFKGYWNNPEKTAADFRDDGFFITGDLGKIDDQGYVHIIGRGKDLIISGGLNIYPKEVEDVIDAIPGVSESAVIGVAHPDLGEAVVAVVVAADGIDEAAILRALGGKLARFKQPKAIIFRAELPRNAMGKVQKVALRADYSALFRD